MKKKKILCIMQFPPPVHGAAVMNSYVQNSALLNATFALDVLGLHYIKKITDFRSAYIKKLYLFIKYWFILLYKLTFSRPDMVYFTITPYGVSFYRDVLMVVLIKIFRIKLVYHLHGKGIKDCYPYHKRLYNYAYHNVDVICLGNKLKEDIPFFKRTPYIVNNGITVINAVSSREKPSYKDGIVRILFLSNFDKTKGVIELLEGAKLLKNSGLNFKMQFIGQFYGQFTKNFFDDFLKTHDLSEKIEVIGPVYGNAKNPYFINNDIFVFPTKNDALPLVLLEAMQFGLPCISTFEGSIPDVIEDNVTGLLCKQRDVEDLANKIELLIRNKALREQMGKRGKERFDKLFTLERFEQNLCETFTKILKK